MKEKGFLFFNCFKQIKMKAKYQVFVRSWLMIFEI